jgi:glycerol kinase
LGYIVALDQGTTSSRAIVFDDAARPIASAQREFDQHYPHPGWVEHDPEAIWQSQRTVMAEALSQAGASDGDVAAVGITNQRETTVVWERETGEPIAPAIVWQDRRTAGLCDQLRGDGYAELVQQRTGLLLDAYFSGTKVRWLLDHVAGARQKAKAGRLAFGTIDSWLIWKLTGGAVHATDVTNASRTMLFDIHRQQWDEELLAMLEVPRSMLGEVVDSAGVVGHVASGLPAAGAPIAGVAGDQQAALVGQLCTEPGMAKNTYGTGCFLLMQTGQMPHTSKNKLLTTIAWRQGGQPTRYALEGSVFVGGAVVQWLRDGLGLIDTARQCDELAATVADAGGALLVPAFVGLGAPHWDPYARGTMVGLTRGTSRAHLCRAALDGIAYSVADLLEAMRGDAATTIRELRVDGGAAASDVLLQAQADLLQVPVVRPAELETTATGAAYLAGLGAGVFASFNELASAWAEGARFEPAIGEAAAQAKMARWHDAVDRARGWAKTERET